MPGGEPVVRGTEPIPRQVLGDFIGAWRRLVTTDLIYKAAAFVVLTPLSALTIQLFIAMSGKTVLSDQDILFFLMRPIGWAALIVVGAIIIGIVAMEMAALMLIGFGAAEDHGVAVVGALSATLRQAKGILMVTARMMGLILLTVAPFALAAGAVYLLLLTDYDINYYLTFKPPEFRLALAVAGLLVAALAVVIVRLVSGWLYALPLLLFLRTAMVG